MLLQERLHDIAGRFPDKLALGFAHESFTFAELDQRSRALAARWRDWGVRPGDRVGLLAEPCAAVVVAFWAALYADAIAVHLNDQFFFASRRRHTSSLCDWSSDVCSSD